ncbi:hypothetical protein JHK86_049449 [Glycine max]|uniref:Neutral ceramidase n=1 Tax=Glycine max TaxID=3847 RepID=K7MQD4_SOYBN|nr:hypothetical protein JHK86_049449 [Glycine max]
MRQDCVIEGALPAKHHEVDEAKRIFSRRINQQAVKIVQTTKTKVRIKRKIIHLVSIVAKKVMLFSDVGGDQMQNVVHIAEFKTKFNHIKGKTDSVVFEDDVLLRRVSNIIPSRHDNHHELLELATSFQFPPGRPVSKTSSVAKRVRTFCIDTGLPCDFNRSTCGRKNELVYSQGPGYPDELETVDLFNAADEEIEGDVDFRHAYIDFSQLELTISDQGYSEVVKTCPATMGFAFSARTTDGPRAFDFQQGDDKGNPFWKLVRDMLKTPSKEQTDCQCPKPILLDTGEMKKPYDWALALNKYNIVSSWSNLLFWDRLLLESHLNCNHPQVDSLAITHKLIALGLRGSPSILPIQILRIGQLIILSVPGEFTTMAGRHLRDAVKTVLTSEEYFEFDDIHIVIAGLTNTYSQYITTYEEYQVQRYEQISIFPPVVVDATPLGVNFGDVCADVPRNSTFKSGDLVTASFWSACPRNDLMTEGTFALVEFLQEKDAWTPAYDDDDFKLSSRSKATLEWRIPQGVAHGVYRLRHFGAVKGLFGSIHCFTGSSTAFVVA